MANNLFNEKMTSAEARAAFFRAVEGKSEGEVAKIKDEYAATVRNITRREFKLAEQGWMF